MATITPDWLTHEVYCNNEVVREGQDEGYGIFSGYVIVVYRKHAAMVYASHCSCYGTWNDNAMDYGTLSWEGTPSKLYQMAKRIADPDMPDRIASANDFNIVHLMKAYESYRKWYEENR